jgi:poly-gamma-glutamate synthesis protein (capsule biosynthesis protein)
MTFDKDTALQIIKQLKNDGCDYIIFEMHWGYEYQTEADQQQIDIGHWLVDNGVDVVVGHHPHVQQKIETYKNKIIAYSLGNFLFQHYKDQVDEVKNGKILQITFGDKLTYNTIDSRCEPPNFNINIIKSKGEK